MVPSVGPESDVQREILVDAEDVFTYRDELGDKKIQDILKLPDSLWASQEGKTVAVIPNTTYVYWVKLDLESDFFENGHWLLELLDSHVNDLTAFCLTDTLEEFKPIGVDHNFAERHYRHKNFIFDIPKTSEKVTVYFRYRTDFYSALLFKIWPNNEFLSYSNGEYYLLGAFYGILILLAVYNLFFFFSLKERFYLYYVLFVLASVFVGLTEDRTGFQYYWETFPFLNAITDKWTPLYFMVSSVLFATSFLRMRKKSRLGWQLIWTSVGMNILYFIYYFNSYNFLWASPVYILPFLIIFVYAIKYQRVGNVQERYFLIGFTFVLIAASIMSFRSQGLAIFYTILGVYTFNFSLILKVVFFSIALAERYRIMKKEHAESQQRVIDQLRENERIIEQKVVERTEQIREQKQIIETNNKELASANSLLENQAEQLKEQSLEIARMNELLRGENLQLQENVEELATARVLVKDVGFAEFSKIFPDDDACYKYLAKVKWSKGYACKKCANEKYSEVAKYGHRCTKCGFNESTTNATIFHRLHFPIQKAFYMLYLVYSHQGDITSTELSKLLDLRQNTCWKFSKKIKERLSRVNDNNEDGWKVLIQD
ncbi:7TMR-DISM family protein [Sediminitomix flava]|uniref:7TMR-DISM extracellular protein 2 n=1 Tax=Sediminitomix flava TaxID=379075 RepID=A0A315Z162_SEDFL|nr:7TM diverse intracellular signaling domain-containing protein [Sediminitomix flava]PWJ36154.1 7TMR-DISM extracellular protein 2 [Sediminitomix flava]